MLETTHTVSEKFEPLVNNAEQLVLITHDRDDTTLNDLPKVDARVGLQGFLVVIYKSHVYEVVNDFSVLVSDRVGRRIFRTFQLNMRRINDYFEDSVRAYLRP